MLAFAIASERMGKKGAEGLYTAYEYTNVYMYACDDSCYIDVATVGIVVGGQ